MELSGPDVRDVELLRNRCRPAYSGPIHPPKRSADPCRACDKRDNPAREQRLGPLTLMKRMVPLESCRELPPPTPDAHRPLEAKEAQEAEDAGKRPV